MIALGVWQLRRAEWKADLIARYSAGAGDVGQRPLAARRGRAGARAVPLEPVRLAQRVLGIRTHRGRPARPARAASRRSPAASSTAAARPKSRSAGRGRPQQIALGRRRGQRVIAPGRHVGGTLHASPPAPGLEPLAPPDPGDLPNNHLVYAGQWFFFALTALVIYVLALRRSAGERPSLLVQPLAQVDAVLEPHLEREQHPGPALAVAVAGLAARRGSRASLPRRSRPACGRRRAA